jgi:alkylation response protein AidB-like acyl-CoA dehydrogenase
MTYRAPVDDILFALKTAGGLDGLIAGGHAGAIDEDTIRAIIEEAGKFGSEVLDPLNRVGDTVGSRLIDGKVVTPPGWKEAYDRFVAGGWSALPCPPEFGGQGLPAVVSTAVCEIWSSANLAFAMGPLLTNGASACLEIGGSEELKRIYMAKLVSGEWSGTMNLTEPQAGSDLSALTTRAERSSDGTYRLFGTKIFISYGDHELTENIIHLVLARLADDGAGTRAPSLFLVPKWLVNSDGSLGARNDVVCAGLEHKLGIRASPTAVMKYGEQGGAVGYLVGEENRGLRTMFVMMNAARLGVGVQGVALAERATQRAIGYARDRRQGRHATSKPGEMGAIIGHADVKRMILTMKSLTQAARAICLATAREIDVAQRSLNVAEREAAQSRAALLTPLAKAFSTDAACEVTSLGVQVHGGMGYVEETGAAQYFRDARILPIYEGTNGIQAIDLAVRKLMLSGGKVVRGYLEELDVTVREVHAANRPDLGRMGDRMAETLAALVEATQWMSKTLQSKPEAALAGATPFLRLFSLAAGAHYLAKGALAAARDDGGSSHIATARFFAENIAVAGPGLAQSVMSGAESVLAFGRDPRSAGQGRVS